MLDQWCLRKINLNTRLEFKFQLLNLLQYTDSNLCDQLSLEDFSKCLEFSLPHSGHNKSAVN